MKKGKVEIRVSVFEKKLMNLKSEHSGLSLSEFGRRAILGQEISYKLTPEEVEIYKQLHEEKRAFASIGNMFKNSDPELNAEVRKLVERFNKHFDKFL